MSSQDHLELEGTDRGGSRSEEVRTFLLFTVVLAPFAAVACVGGFGLFIWMLQILYGPPTH